MAVQVIAFPVAARQNTNDDSTAYGKWFLVPFWPETLNLRGLIERNHGVGSTDHFLKFLYYT